MARTYEISTEKGFDRLLVAVTEECFNLGLEKIERDAILETIQEYAPRQWADKHTKILESSDIVKDLPEEQEAEDEDDD